MISYEVSEETEVLTDLSRMMNCFGLMAHSLLLRRVFKGEFFDRLCRKSFVRAFLRLYFY
jgi:hypothetical protein